MQLVTRQIVNESGQVELWLGDSSRRLTAEELKSLGAAVSEAQAKLERQRKMNAATSLTDLLIFNWSVDEQRFVAFAQDDTGNYIVRLSHDEVENLRLQVLERRAKANRETVGGPGFVIGGTAP